jgi:hypothetical protein
VLLFRGQQLNAADRRLLPEMPAASPVPRAVLSELHMTNAA